MSIEIPGSVSMRVVGWGLAALAAAGLVAWAVHGIRKDAVDDAAFKNVQGKLETTEQSAEISREASDAAGRIVEGLSHASVEDRRAVSAARRPGATAADRERVQLRAIEAYAQGLCAARRLQREDCGAAASPTPAD